MPRSSSLVRRVAWGAALGASAAALLAALSTSVFAALLLQRAEDRRLHDAVVILADELGAEPHRVEEVVREEQTEAAHSGIRFAAFGPEGLLLAGDRSVPHVAADGCAGHGPSGQRVCRRGVANGLVAVAASTHALPLSAFAFAALAAALLAAVLAWLLSRPMSRVAVGPLSRLRARIDALDVDSHSPVDLGPSEQVLEVDALRDTIAQLVQRLQRSLDQAQRFAANAAHELRTPLTSVRAELELLSESMLSESALSQSALRGGAAPDGAALDGARAASMRDDVVRAQTKLTELGLLVERLLVLSVPALAPRDGHEMVSLRDLFEDVVAELPPSDRARVAVSEADALVAGDAVLLGLLVSNALSNALKFGAEVRVSVTVSGPAVTFRVDDDGPGVDADEREQVFEPFFRTSVALRRRLPGHGLGLALVRHVARMHGGDARFVDAPETGAHLEVRLPLAAASRGPQAKALPS